MRFLLTIALLLPALAPAAEGDPPAAAEAEPVDAEVEPEAAPLDPFTIRLMGLVDRYYGGISADPSDADRAAALESIRLMLLDGVALPRVTAAVEDAVRLHTPGRVVPFHIAVPLRVRPADPAPPLGKRVGSAPAPNFDVPPPPARPLDPEIEAKRAAQREVAQVRRTRLRLYRQWRSRTKEKRTLLTIGVPLWAAGYSLGFATAGLNNIQGLVSHEVTWFAAIPIVGNLLYGIATQGLYPASFLFASLEITGAALTIASFALKADWPYDKDPTAMKLGHTRDGRAALVLAPRPLGLGGALTGRF